MSRRIALPLSAAALAAVFVAGATTAGGQSAASGDRALYAALSGAKEIGEDGQRSAGDRNGFGSASATVDGGRLCFGITVKNLDQPAAAHIHRGGPGANGPVVIELKAPSDGDPGAVAGCVSARTSLTRQIRRTPSRFYFNVHTQRYPNGAVRGQVRLAR